MQQQKFINILKNPHQIELSSINELELLVKEYPFFSTAYLLYLKGLQKNQLINYSKQLRKTAIVANSRSVLYELLHKSQLNEAPESQIEDLANSSNTHQLKPEINSVTVTNNDVKVIYYNSVANDIKTIEHKATIEETPDRELDIVKSIENETESSSQDFDINKLNESIEQEISKGIIQSYVEVDIIKTPELNKEEKTEPVSFTDWLKTIQKEAHTFQIQTKPEITNAIDEVKNHQKNKENALKNTVFEEKKQLIDKIIESDPGRIKLGTNKFFTPASEAKQSLLENEHLVTETLAKIYALQGNISKAIRAYEILSLKFPQKSVYFASLIEKLKTNK